MLVNVSMTTVLFTAANHSHIFLEILKCIFHVKFLSMHMLRYLLELIMSGVSLRVSMMDNLHSHTFLFTYLDGLAFSLRLKCNIMFYIFISHKCCYDL